jgi:hypothetical protein
MRMQLASLFVGGIVAYLCSLTSLGRIILNALDQDVIGAMPGERTEMRVVGAIVGFLIGAFGMTCLWKVIEARLQTKK